MMFVIVFLTWMRFLSVHTFTHVQPYTSTELCGFHGITRGYMFGLCVLNSGCDWVVLRKAPISVLGKLSQKPDELLAGLNTSDIIEEAVILAVAQLKWIGKCTNNPYALNDCNWCRCNTHHEYSCDARECREVDMFGHFNDAIREFDYGMNGHGVWRNLETPCEPNVKYRKGELLCVCTENGFWPNPVCRDSFQILHLVELTGESQVRYQQCTPTKLYLVSCNVCFCAPEGILKPDFCTKHKCYEDDPVIKQSSLDNTEPKDENLSDYNEALEIYAECQPDNNYKLGCQTCKCLRNNRLLCDNCTETSSEIDNTGKSYCDSFKPGQVFSRDCNLCYCDKQKFLYCTAKKCLPNEELVIPKKLVTRALTEVDEDFNGENCIPGHHYKINCNTCYCIVSKRHKYFGCTLKLCGARTEADAIHNDCVKGTVYERNCLICHCDDINGVRTELCKVNPKCQNGFRSKSTRANDLDSLFGYCEPLQVYERDCNTCTCLSDGKTLRCTSQICDKEQSEPISVDVVPISQKGAACPKGMSYKVDCNYCFCLSNGNAICTTAKCSKRNLD